MAHEYSNPIRYNAGDGNVSGLAGQQAKPAIDRQSLEAALLDMDYPGRSVSVRIVIDAARKHLETLPKPVWRVTGVLAGTGRSAAPYETTDHDAALDFARDYLKQGINYVCIRQVYP